MKFLISWAALLILPILVSAGMVVVHPAIVHGFRGLGTHFEDTSKTESNTSNFIWENSSVFDMPVESKNSVFGFYFGKFIMCQHHTRLEPNRPADGTFSRRNWLPIWENSRLPVVQVGLKFLAVKQNKFIGVFGNESWGTPVVPKVEKFVRSTFPFWHTRIEIPICWKFFQHNPRSFYIDEGVHVLSGGIGALCGSFHRANQKII
jgi:hypothetical protein